METTGLEFGTLNNARKYAIETLKMEGDSIALQRKTTANLTRNNN
jgi:hypothetical protein